MKYLLAFIFLSVTVLSKSQESSFGFDAKFNHGFLLAHRPTMAHLPVEHAQALELAFFWKMNGAKNWHQAYHFPEVGFAVLSTESGNTPILGHFFGSFAFLKLRFFENDKSGFYTRIGTGIGYTNKVFDQKSDPKNNVISSHFNALINWSLFYQYSFSKNRIRFGFDMTHFSNGATTLPNLGINLAYLNLSYGRTIRQHEKNIQANFSNKVNSEWKTSIIGIFGLEGAIVSGDPRYKLWALSASGQKVYKHGLGWELGTDLIFKKSIDIYKPVISKPLENHFQLGVYSTYFASLNNLQIHVGMGVYVRDIFDQDGPIYHRLGFKYSCKNGLLMNLTLKSHWAKADYVEYGIGYRF